jgi:sporulation protein YlmC with PRC-barrel domain
MIRSIEQIRGAGIEATDGPVGDVHDVYFDDHEWIIRYYVVDTGKWLPGRKVLIPPQAVRQMMPGHSGLPVNLTREQVQSSPDIDMDRPVSRQAELVLYRHYGWAPYWFPLAPATPIVIAGDAADRELDVTSGHAGDPHLRSAREVNGYHVAATDGEIGHIDDFLFDDETATIKYAIVDTTNWRPGGQVLISPKWIREVKWSESKIFVNLTREAVRNSPEYNPVTPVNKDYEARLFEHYGYPIELL